MRVKCATMAWHTFDTALEGKNKMSELKDKIIAEIKTCYDPEIPVNIYDLGLIYKIEILEGNKVKVDMTLTSPNCPVADWLPESVKQSIMRVEGVTDVDLKLVWEPPWDKSKCLRQP